MPAKLLDDCFLHDKDRLRHGEALNLLEVRVRPVVPHEKVALEAAAGRILANPVIAPRPVPGTDNSAMDGYAFAHADYVTSAGRLPLSGRITAGHAQSGPIRPGTAVRIFTGAVMPQGADTVAMQEDVTEVAGADGPVAQIPKGLKFGANRRLAGEDVRVGDVILEANTRLRPQDIAAAASTGSAHLDCFAPLQVALFSTGDEILRPGQPFSPGNVYDSNHFMLRALIESTGATVTDLGILEDNAATVRAALQKAAATHDAIVTSGGASRGEEDHVVKSIEALGNLHMWQLAIKPGRPMSFGQISDCVFLGLPGNPVAAMVCFLLYVRCVLLRLGGANWPRTLHYELPAAFSMKKKTGRREFLRGRVEITPQGRPVVHKFERDGSGLISSLRAADGLISINEDTSSVGKGDLVSFIPFSELGIVAR
ncbi:MAG: molybdopterin molybdotransferase MoeA [Fimbriimonadaceae bacterium]|nr:molybdopterin molybdotransferase MoeA [Alphaproteobacteria bacterium]